MFRLFKIAMGALFAAFLMGLAAPAWGETAGQRQDQKPCTRFPSTCPFQEVQVNERRLREPARSPLDEFLRFFGIDARGNRVRVPDVYRPSPVTLAQATLIRGTIETNYAEDGELLVLRDYTGARWTFFVAKDCKVLINNKEASLSDLQNGDAAVVAHEIRGLIPMVAVEIRVSRN
jgi:hypothetical protein